MTEYGKHGKPRSRLSTLPTLFGNPFGITTFPRPRLLAYFKVRKHERQNPRQLVLKGVVTEVFGPMCNGCSGTLTPLRSFGCCFCSSVPRGGGESRHSAAVTSVAVIAFWGGPRQRSGGAKTALLTASDGAKVPKPRRSLGTLERGQFAQQTLSSSEAVNVKNCK